MKSVFLSFTFSDNDRDLVADVERLLASHALLATTGKRLGGNALDPAVQRRIDQSDALMAFLTRREALANGGWTTHPWVLDEFKYARSTDKPAIALVEDGVNVGGMYSSHEYIPFHRDRPLPAIIALSETIGLWKTEAGRTLKVRILPEQLARMGRGHDGSFQCRFRLFSNARYTPWSDVYPVFEPGGTFVYLGGIQDDHMIQMEVEAGRTTWISPTSSQWMPLELNSNGAS